MIHTVPIPGVPKAACCSACAMGKLGDSSDSGSFSDFLSANPDLSAQYSSYQAANPGDPVLQSVMYNPLTNTIGPVTIPAQSTGDEPGSSTAPAFLAIAGLVAAAFVIGSNKR
jgi:hypothetical protein